MQLQEHDGVPDFLDAAAPVLDAYEARHNLIFGICSTLLDAPDAYADVHLWTVLGAPNERKLTLSLVVSYGASRKTRTG